MTYPLKERTYFKTAALAWAFVQMVEPLGHHVVADYGVSDKNANEPYFIETVYDPFATKDEILQKVNII